MGIDAQNQGAGLPQDKGVGFIAEEVLVDILRNRLPDMSVRLSTSGEDSGLTWKQGFQVVEGNEKTASRIHGRRPVK